MAKKVIKKYQGDTGSSTTGPATKRPMSSDELRREQNRTGKTAEEYYKSEDYARVQRKLDELNARNQAKPKGPGPINTPPTEIKTYGPKAKSRPLSRPTPPPDTRSTNEKVGIPRPTGNNPLNNGVYRGTKLTPAQIKQSQEDWKKKEREKTNPKNKPAGSALTPLKRGGSIKRK